MSFRAFMAFPAVFFFLNKENLKLSLYGGLAAMYDVSALAFTKPHTRLGVIFIRARYRGYQSIDRLYN